MSSEHLVGTSIPRFTFDTPTKPGNDFYALCEGERPLVMIFLPAFDHPVTREYLTHYLKTCARLRGVRLACVVRSSARTVAQATQGAEFPFSIICDAPGVLYSYLGVEQARGILSWSFAAQRIYKTAREQGYRYQHDVIDLLRALDIIAERSQRQLPPPTANFRGIVGKEPYPIGRKTGEVLRQLLLRGVERLKNLFRGSRSRSEVVATFLAILDLCKTNSVTLEDDPGGENPNVRLLDKHPREEMT